MEDLELFKDENGILTIAPLLIFKDKRGNKIPYKGHVGSRKGRKLSEKTRKKISENLKKRKVTLETRRKLSASKKGNKNMLGKNHTTETREKMSKAQRGHIVTEEARCKQSESMKGKHHSVETRQKQSESHRGEKAPLAKLTEVDVREIKIALANGESGASIARRYGVAKTNISAIKSGKTWAHVEVSP